MVKVQIGAVSVNLNKNEAKEVERLSGEVQYVKSNGNKAEDKEALQRHADIWMRSAPTQVAQDRRKLAVRALGLSDEIKFL